MMSEELKKLIKNYGIDVEDELDVSPFEIAYTFRTREFLAKQYELLDSEDKKRLAYYDTVLISRAKEFYEYFKPLKIWGNSNVPIEYWWWHLEKIILGELIVEVEKNEINYRGNITRLTIK
ncbi:hypothetical protein SAMN04488168_11044 [Bacillus sp. 491mf]|nr:hypothetical protein SAMN04488168_11044 [Bacillus sp. 491mf]